MNSVYDRIQRHIYHTNFQYETGGLLLGHKFLRTYYVIACTFPNCCRNVQATKMTFVLDGREHTEKMNQIQNKCVIPLRLLGVWHSHTTQDDLLSAQDKKSSRALAKKNGQVISMIITKQKQGTIKITSYCILKGNREVSCRTKIAKIL